MLFVLFTLYCALKGRWDTAGVLLGLSTHWKIYPFVYGVACLGVIGQGGYGLARVVNKKTIRFGLLSAGTFGILGTSLYLMYVSYYLMRSSFIRNL